MKTKKAGGPVLWGGRFQGGMDPALRQLSFSLAVDGRLFPEDVEGTLGQVEALRQARVLSPAEAGRLRRELARLKKEYLAGKSLFLPSDEDVHSALERLLTVRLGVLGKKVHTGRSRNDQVATDLRLFLRRACTAVLTELHALQGAILTASRRVEGLVMPGYTHVQQAQPVLAAHYLLSLFWALERDRSRFTHCLAGQGEMPLGSGALAGSAFAYDRERVARLLGFEGASRNSMDATAHRDLALEFLSACAILGSSVSRYAEDLVIWSSAEFRFADLGDGLTTGSSMMPQKRNPDSMELVRGKAGRLLGNFSTLFCVLKGLPLCYSRDLQEDKPPVFDSFDTVMAVLPVMRRAMEGLRLDRRRIAAAMDGSMLATDLADLLVKKGIPFREAHHQVGALAARAVELGVPFLDLPAAEWKRLPGGESLRRALSFPASVARRNIEGGTGPKAVARQLREAETLWQAACPSAVRGARRPAPGKATRVRRR